MIRLTLIVGVRITVGIWVRVIRVWVRPEPYNWSNIKDYPYREGRCGVKNWVYRTTLRVVVRRRGRGGPGTG